MTTIIDRLVVELELDPKNFTKGQREAVEAARRAEGELGRSSRNLEARGRSVGQTFGALTTKAVGFLAVFAGAASLKSFATNIVNADAATGRLAHNLGMGVSQLSAWQGAVKQVGGQAQDADASLSALVSTFEQIRLTGSSPAIPYLQQLGIASLDQLRDVNGALLTMADRMKGMDPSRAQALGRGAGLTEATVNLLMKGREEVTRYLQAQRDAGVATAESAAKSAELNRELELTKARFADIGRELLSGAIPAINQLLDLIQKLKDNLSDPNWSPGWIEKIRERIKPLNDFLERVDRRFPSGDKPPAAAPGAASGVAKPLSPAASGVAKPLSPAADAAVRTLVTEAKKGDYQGMKDVAHVIRNRMAAMPGTNAEDIVKAPGQFEPWMNGRAQAVDPNSKEYQDATAAWIAADAERKRGLDPTKGSTHFVSPAGQAALGRNMPSFSTENGPARLVRGGHEFYGGNFNRVRPGSGAGRHASGGGTVTSTTNVGTINVNTQATDAPGIARDIGQSLADYNYVAQANTGMQ